MTSQISSFFGQLLVIDHVIQNGKSRFTFKAIQPDRTADVVSKYPDPTALVDKAMAVIMPAAFKDPAVLKQAKDFSQHRPKNPTLYGVLTSINVAAAEPLAKLPRGTSITLGRGVTLTIQGAVRNTNSFRGLDPRKVEAFLHTMPNFHGGTITGLGVVTLDNPIGLVPKFLYELPNTACVLQSSRLLDTRNVVNNAGKEELAAVLSQESALVAREASQRAQRGPATRAIRGAAARGSTRGRAACAGVSYDKIARAASAVAQLSDEVVGFPVNARSLSRASASSTSSRASSTSSRVSSVRRGVSRAGKASPARVAPQTIVTLSPARSASSGLAGARSPGRMTQGSPARSPSQSSSRSGGSAGAVTTNVRQQGGRGRQQRRRQ